MKRKIIPREERVIRKVLRSESRDFPDELEGRMEAILRTINTEYKTITLGFVLDEMPSTSTDLMKGVERLSGNVPRSQTFKDYAEKTFVPIGMVAEQEMDYESFPVPVKTWRISEAGKEFGRPIAAFTLDYVVRHGKSMFPLLGNTGTTGDSNSPLNRYKILKSMANGNRRNADISASLGLYNTLVTHHLVKLKGIGLVDYESICTEQPFVFYQWKEDVPRDLRPPKESQKYPKLATEVADVIRQGGKWSNQQMADFLGRDLDTVSPVLYSLFEQGILEHSLASRGNMSTSSLTPEWAEFLAEYLEKIESALQGGNELNAMGNVRTDYLADLDKLREHATEAGALYQAVSPFYSKAMESSERQQMIMDFIGGYQNEGGPRTKEIEDYVGVKLSNYLASLLKDGMIERVRIGNETRYRLPANLSLGE